MGLLTMMHNQIDQHQYDNLVLFVKENYSSIRIWELDEVIEVVKENPKDYKGKQKKYNRVVEIIEEKCDEARKLNGYF